MTPAPGSSSTDHWRVGLRHRVMDARAVRDPQGALEGVCQAVTYWGNGRVRWVRLAFTDGTVRSYSPTHVRALQ